MEYCSRSFGLQHRERFERQDDVFFACSGAGNDLGADTLADTMGFRSASPMMRAANQQVGRVLPLHTTPSTYGSGLVLHVQQLRRVGDQRARRSPFIQKDA